MTENTISGDLAEMRVALLDWFAVFGRDLPWRRTRDPYRIMVSEIMLQQTQVDRVIPKYHAFLEAFPTLEALAAAPTAEVIRAWSGLGYNRRAVNMQRAARAVLDEHGGQFPRDFAALLRLPGIGPYTAGAIACFAFEQDVAFIDTNIRRVVQRLFVGPADLSQSYGIPLQTQAPVMRAAVERVAEAAARHGKWWGLPVGSAEAAQGYYEMGARFLACGAAIIILQQGWRRIREDFDALLNR